MSDLDGCYDKGMSTGQLFILINTCRCALH